MDSQVPTRILVISDTHGANPTNNHFEPVDLVIHCGDLTQESKLDEFKQAVALLQSLDAPLKLVIAGNHDFTLDTPAFEQKLTEAGLKPPHEDKAVRDAYGGFGEARALLRGDSWVTLANGAMLKVYASPYTPSKAGGWGFCYDPDEGHDWKIGKDVDVAITHDPCRGILDYTHNKQRAGCPELFAAMARARPLLHCFGHIHEAWGAKKITWRGSESSDRPSHFTDIDNDNSELIGGLVSLQPGRFDSAAEKLLKEQKSWGLVKKGYCYTAARVERGMQTLFVNAAFEGAETEQQQLPWLVQLDLPRNT